METLLEVLLEVLGEFLLEFLLQLIVEFGVRALLAPLRATVGATLRWPLLALVGAGCGGLSLLVAPHAFLATPLLRVVNLVVSPVLAGAAVAWLGATRARRGRDLMPLDRFGGGFALALAFALVRFAYAH